MRVLGFVAEDATDPDLFSRTANDFTVIDGGAVVGVTEFHGITGDASATWYFSHVEKSAFYNAYIERLMAASLAARDFLTRYIGNLRR